MSGLLVDLFAGAGGASVGIEAAMGRSVDVAINHDATAVAVHAANHPDTLHLKTDVWEVDPLDATGGRPVELLWASPDCRHFSRAKGGVPRSPKVRSLAWVIVKWAQAVRPRVIVCENVVEFATWGPLGKDGCPIKARAGETYSGWVRALRNRGYEVESRVLDASLYGAPTRRRRLFIVARRDGQPIAWPKPTHGPGLLPLRTAAECIDWSLPCPSIFDRKRPLAPATLRRVAEGIRRFVLGKAEPFVVELAAPLVAPNMANNVPRPATDPMPTVTGGNRNMLVSPTLAKFRYDSAGQRVDAPMPTITAGNGREGRPAGAGHALGLVAPTLVQTGHGERAGQTPRVPGLGKPLGAVCAGGAKRAVVAAYLAHHYGGEVGREATKPLGVVTARDHHTLVTAHVEKFFGTAKGQRVDEPLHTATTKARFALVETFLERHGIAGPHVVRVAGESYAIADIGLRMLEPHELLHAQFGPFAESYDLSAATTKAGKIRLIGNSVAPQVAEAIVRANLRGAARVARQPDLFGATA